MDIFIYYLKLHVAPAVFQLSNSFVCMRVSIGEYVMNISPNSKYNTFLHTYWHANITFQILNPVPSNDSIYSLMSS